MCSAFDSKERFGKKSSKYALINKFYVDDLLKSLASAEEPTKFIQNIVKISSTGGFTKFINNNSDVLASIPEKEELV